MKTQNRRILALATTILLFFPVILAQKVSTAASLHETHQDHDHDHDEHEHQHDHGEHHEHGGGHHEEEGHGGHEKNELVSEKFYVKSNLGNVLVIQCGNYKIFCHSDFS